MFLYKDRVVMTELLFNILKDKKQQDVIC